VFVESSAALIGCGPTFGEAVMVTVSRVEEDRGSRMRPTGSPTGFYESSRSCASPLPLRSLFDVGDQGSVSLIRSTPKSAR
jgi:hypothetical protein